MSSSGPAAPAMLAKESLLVQVVLAVNAAVSRLTLSVSPRENLEKFRSYRWSRLDKFKYGTMLAIAVFSIAVMGSPSFPVKLLIPAAYIVALLIPLTSQLILPASPILLWLLLFYSCRFIDVSARPHIWVSVLPTLETIWYGASISDILTRFGHPLLDVLAWIPYGVVHFAAPFVVAVLVFVFAPEGSVKVFASSFGFMNLAGVLIQIAFPCAPPWYELREGLTPANYGMRGSPAGLARIDALFGGIVYTMGFSSAPVVFGAFPSLHAACATCEALVLSYFFPIKLSVGRWRFDTRIFYWMYAFWLYWSTMYLMHHYLIDLVAGGCLATMSFYLCRTETVREAMEERVALMEREEHLRRGEPVEDALTLDHMPFKTQNNESATEEAIFAIDEDTAPHDTPRS
ncbi:Phosphatidylinositol:ceramide phosphoinositol transferase (IPC synthase) [Malassezia nana]|uniref:Phosphatidylinositol:ceramide phosphoinositol transferase (IPC synthase) n=1 Tax=Malassezia nana TaxID=180528 RepID=A0AAF0EPZ9_9BASI|nr:Phosphatidylinositol:ceramide phosphoinositol transferase (IPC synthase) [Malassezia nana]